MFFCIVVLCLFAEVSYAEMIHHCRDAAGRFTECEGAPYRPVNRSEVSWGKVAITFFLGVFVSFSMASAIDGFYRLMFNVIGIISLIAVIYWTAELLS